MRKSLASASVIAAVLFTLSCGDNRTALPTAPQLLPSAQPSRNQQSPVLSACITQSALEAEFIAAIPAGANRTSVMANVTKLEAAVARKDVAGVQALALTISTSLVQLYLTRQLTSTPLQFAKLVFDLFCFAGTSGGGSGGPVPGTCTTQSALEAEINAVVPSGSNRRAMLSDVGKLDADIDKRDFAGAQSLAFSISRTLNQLYKARQLTGSAAQVAKLVNDLFCYSGLTIAITDPANAAVVSPTDGAQVIVNSSALAGVSLPAGAVSEPTVIQFIALPDTFAAGKGPLNTKLDQYSGFYSITSSSATGAPLAKPVVVGVCPPAGMDATVRARLRLGHQASYGFEITPTADASFLSCPTSLGAAANKTPGWLKALTSFVLPKVAYARIPMFVAGGVGGTAGEFSILRPRTSSVDPVDPVGPVKPAPPTSASVLFKQAPVSFSVDAFGNCVATAAAWGQPLEPACRPVVTVVTNLGHILTRVPISWALAPGGGAVAPEDSTGSCRGSFGSSATDSTDVNGKAGICWTMGSTPGTNTVVATPNAGGDAPAGVTFVPATYPFVATVLKRPAKVVISCVDSAYNGAVRNPCSAVVTDSASGASLGSVPITYGPTTPQNAGTYTADATYAGSALYLGAQAVQKTFHILSAPLDFTWTGTVSTDWNTGGNWSGGVVPGSANNVVIPSGTPFAPNTSVTWTNVHNVTVASGATVQLSGGNLQVLGDLTINAGGRIDEPGNFSVMTTGNVVADTAAPGAVTTCHAGGGVHLNGAGHTVTGRFCQLGVYGGGTYTASGPIVVDTVPGNAALSGGFFVGNAGSNFTLGGHHVFVHSLLDGSSGNSTGTITMTNAADSLIVAADATFAGAPATGLMTAGNLFVGGNLTVTGASLDASGTHTTTLNGSTLQTLTWNLAPWQHGFQNLIFSGAGGKRFGGAAGNCFINGNVLLASSLTPNFVSDSVDAIYIGGSLTDNSPIPGGGWQASLPSWVFFTGTPTALPATFMVGGITFQGGTTVSLPNNLSANQVVVSGAGSNLKLNGHTLHTNLFFLTQNGGTLQMTNPADSLDAWGAEFDGGSTSGLLTNGGMAFGALYQGFNGVTRVPAASASAFSPSAGLRAHTFASGPADIYFKDPGTGSGFSHFWMLQASRTAPAFLFTNVFVDSLLVGEYAGSNLWSDSTTQGIVRTVTTKGIYNSGTYGMTLMGVNIVLNDGAAPSTWFNNVTWNGFPAGYTGTLFTQNRTTAGPQIGTNNWSAVSLGVGGAYLRNTGTSILSVGSGNSSCTVSLATGLSCP